MLHALIMLLDIVQSSAEQLVQERLGQKAESILMGKYMIAKQVDKLKGKICEDLFFIASGDRYTDLMMTIPWLSAI